MKPESAIQRQIRAYLTARGIESVHVPNGAVLAGDAKSRAIQMNAMKRDGLQNTVRRDVVIPSWNHAASLFQASRSQPLRSALAINSASVRTSEPKPYFQKFAFGFGLPSRSTR